MIDRLTLFVFVNFADAILFGGPIWLCTRFFFFLPVSLLRDIMVMGVVWWLTRRGISINSGLNCRSQCYDLGYTPLCLSLFWIFCEFFLKILHFVEPFQFVGGVNDRIEWSAVQLIVPTDLDIQHILACF